MKYPIESIGQLLLTPLREYFQEKSLDRNDQQGKSPFRSEIFSMDQMLKLANKLAVEHCITHKDSKEQLLRRLSDNEAVLIHVTALLKDSVKKKNPITPASLYVAVMHEIGDLYRPIASLRYRVLITSTVIFILGIG